MSAQPNSGLPSVTVHEDQLVREETFTDLHAATIRRLTPVTPDGERDASRPVRFSGHTQIMSSAGALPLDFEIDAQDLAAAFKAFPAQVETALQELAAQMESLQRERASRIVSPREAAGPNLIIP
ncbi:MAG: hypothetical protein U1E27_04815 [Kiritimatiellia bacterium]|nr:hypothetical protein [Kiritimatiellia bacterium]